MAHDLGQFSDEELHRSIWASGALDYYLHTSDRGQQEVWALLMAWFAQDSSKEMRGQFARIFVLAISRRWGKTALCLFWLAFLAHFLPPIIGRPVKLRYTTALQQSIDTIVGEVIDDVFRYAPAEFKPTYYGKRGTKPAGLYFPNGSRIAMAGLDIHPKALRGQASDGDVVSEAGFVNGLEETVAAVLYQQYQGRPWARMILESSAPDKLHTAWEVVFMPDAKVRDAFFTATIFDNPMLAVEERDEFIRATGGMDAPRTRREYLNEIIADPELQTFPELGQQHMFEPGDWVRPVHCIALSGYDPGHRHLFAQLFAVYDHTLGAIVIEDCWAEANASTEKVAAVTAAREWDLWGTWPPAKMQRIPLHDTLDSSGRVLQLGWISLLADDRCAMHAEKLHELAQIDAKKRPEDPSSWPYPHYRRNNDYEGLSFWDKNQERFRPNPIGRVSDIKPELIHDLITMFGLHVEPTTKDELRVMVWVVRSWLGRGRIRFTKRAQLAFDHVKACMWNDQRDKFAEHEGKVYGHFDLAADLVYLVRYVEQKFENINPEPPEYRGGYLGPDHVGQPAWTKPQHASLMSEIF